MVDVTYEDQLDKEGVIIGQYAHVTRVVKTEKAVYNKNELIKQRNKLTAEELENINIDRLKK